MFSKLTRVLCPAALAACFVFAASGCGSPPSRGQEGETCVGVPFSCDKGRLESCCAANQCTYRVSDGTDFPCDGTDCTAAAEEATAYCRG